MPYHHVFSNLIGRGEIKVSPVGWTNLSIEYGYGYIGMQQNFYWRVKGSEHTFHIPLQTLNELSKGDYESHIEYVLENFRREYLSWAATGFSEEWMREYHNEFKNFIEI
jgi:hypothetical protein